jgi:hypothetical protein
MISYAAAFLGKPSAVRTVKQQKLIEGVHFYFNEDGLMVLTAQYLRERGYCCGTGCKHCPYSPEEFQAARARRQGGGAGRRSTRKS